MNLLRSWLWKLRLSKSSCWSINKKMISWQRDWVSWRILLERTSVRKRRWKENSLRVSGYLKNLRCRRHRLNNRRSNTRGSYSGFRKRCTKKRLIYRGLKRKHRKRLMNWLALRKPLKKALLIKNSKEIRAIAVNLD